MPANRLLNTPLIVLVLVFHYGLCILFVMQGRRLVRKWNRLLQTRSLHGVLIVGILLSLFCTTEKRTTHSSLEHDELEATVSHEAYLVITAQKKTNPERLSSLTVNRPVSIQSAIQPGFRTGPDCSKPFAFLPTFTLSLIRTQTTSSFL